MGEGFLICADQTSCSLPVRIRSGDEMCRIVSCYLHINFYNNLPTHGSYIEPRRPPPTRYHYLMNAWGLFYSFYGATVSRFGVEYFRKAQHVRKRRYFFNARALSSHFQPTHHEPVHSEGRNDLPSPATPFQRRTMLWITVLNTSGILDQTPSKLDINVGFLMKTRHNVKKKHKKRPNEHYFIYV